MIGGLPGQAEPENSPLIGAFKGVDYVSSARRRGEMFFF
jgi:hypothetical protein